MRQSLAALHRFCITPRSVQWGTHLLPPHDPSLPLLPLREERAGERRPVLLSPTWLQLCVVSSPLRPLRPLRESVLPESGEASRKGREGRKGFRFFKSSPPSTSFIFVARLI